MQLLSLKGLFLLLLLIIIILLHVPVIVARWLLAGRLVAGLTRRRFDALALIIGEVGDGLREGEQHPALDCAPLSPGTARSAAGLPSTGDEAGNGR